MNGERKERQCFGRNQFFDGFRATLRIVRWIILSVGVGCLSQWIGTAVYAQNRNPCAQDAATFCKDVQPGGGRIVRCLAQHLQELTPGCRDMLSRLAASQGGGSEKQASPPDEVQAPVPKEHQKMYAALKKILDEYDARLSAQDTGEKYPVTFGAELLPANGNRGKALLRPQAIEGVALYLDRLKSLGVQGATVAINYPIYTPGFPEYDGYVAFFKRVAQEVKKRGMKLDVESGVVFANTSFSDLSVSYAGLTFEKYKAEKRPMVAAMIKDLDPDYLNLGSEPDTKAILTELKEFNDPKKYTEYVKYVLDGLDRGRTRIIAGIGTWGNMEYVKRLAADTSLDCINMHVYPIIKGDMEKTIAIAEIARQHHKGLVLDEAWLYKSDKYLGNGNAAWSELFRRDVFSFWAALDQQFLASLVKFARLNGVEYFSPFWANYFFAYLDYEGRYAKLPYKELMGIQNKTAAANILNGKFTSTGEFYRKLIEGNQ